MNLSLLVATTNRGKLREIGAVLDGLGVATCSLDDCPPMAVPIEDQPTFRGNALLKARHYATLSHRITLADDSGLEVDALGGRPGVLSARFAGPDCDPAANNRALIEQLMSTPASDRTARFRCAIAVVAPSGAALEAEGCLTGRIIDPPRGTGGFGYDPHFVVPALNRTLAELCSEHKNRISHRGAALRALAPRLGTWLSELQTKADES